MSTVWVVSAVLGWAVIALLVAVVVSLLRQTAELRLRLDAFDGGELFDAPDDDARLHEPVPATVVPLVPSAPADADGGSAEDGDAPSGARATPASGAATLGGSASPAGGPAASLLTLGGLQDRATLLVFHSPGCHGCVGIEEAVEELAAEDPAVRVVSVLALRQDDAADHLRRRPLAGVPTVSVDALPQELRRPTTPAMLGLSRDGTVALLGRPAGVDDLRRAADATARA